MTLDGLKRHLHQTAEKYFTGGAVIWAEQANVKPPLPYMTLKISSVSRAAFPIEEEETSARQRAYQCSSILEASLYTKGSPVTAAGNTTAGHINTALSGMARFSSYLESEYVTDMLADKGIAISLMPPVRDLSFLENGNAYRYRAMAEYAVSFAMEADGAYGISCIGIPDGGDGAGMPGSGSHSGSSGLGDSGDAGQSSPGSDGGSGPSGSGGSGDAGPSGSGSPGDGGPSGPGSSGGTGEPGSGSGAGTEAPDTGNAWDPGAQDFSNGGTEELAGTLIGAIEEVEITGEYKG